MCLKVKLGNWLRGFTIAELLSCVGLHELNRVNFHIPNVQDNLVSHRNGHKVVGDRATDRLAVKIDGDIQVEVESEQFVHIGESRVIDCRLLRNEAVQGAG